MKDLLSSIKPAVRQLQAYTLKHFEARVKINQNENPLTCPAVVKAAVNKVMADRAWCRYPAFVPTELATRLARLCELAQRRCAGGKRLQRTH
jgi:histidinol-phosphate aminotransferase